MTAQKNLVKGAYILWIIYESVQNLEVKDLCQLVR